jgi:hypothetical protein
LSAHRCRHVRALDRLEADRPRAIRLAPGLGLLPVAIVDQHFSQRRRLARLLTALAREPGLIGIGVDEDTALVVEAGRGVEVVGHGTVTLVDASRVRSNYGDVGAERPIRLLGVRLHLCPPATPTRCRRWSVAGRRSSTRRRRSTRCGTCWSASWGHESVLAWRTHSVDAGGSSRGTYQSWSRIAHSSR